MRKVNIFFLACFFLVLSIGQSGCYGPFKLTKNLHEWNSTVGSKFVNALVFFAFIIVPVYGVTVFIDGVVLNTIEFWTGDNPITMGENDKDVQVVKKDGNKYRITATKNKFHIEQLQGENKGDTAELIFDPENSSWNLKDGNKELQKLIQVNEEANLIQIYKPNGQILTFDQNTTNLALIKAKLETESINWSMK